MIKSSCTVKWYGKYYFVLFHVRHRAKDIPIVIETKANYWVKGILTIPVGKYMYEIRGNYSFIS
jgi:hypothetical protein